MTEYPKGQPWACEYPDSFGRRHTAYGLTAQSAERKARRLADDLGVNKARYEAYDVRESTRDLMDKR